jgi:hypothetical protein
MDGSNHEEIRKKNKWSKTAPYACNGWSRVRDIWKLMIFLI